VDELSLEVARRVGCFNELEIAERGSEFGEIESVARSEAISTNLVVAGLLGIAGLELASQRVEAAFSA